MLAIVRFDLLESYFFIRTGLRVAFPGVDRKTARASVIFGNGLTKSEIAYATISPQFDHEGRLLFRDQVIGKWRCSVQAPTP